MPKQHAGTRVMTFGFGIEQHGISINWALMDMPVLEKGKMMTMEKKTNPPVPVKSTALATEDEDIEYVDAEPIDPETEWINVPPIQMEIRLSDALNVIDIWGHVTDGTEHEVSTYFYPAKSERSYIDNEDANADQKALENKDGSVKMEKKD